MQDTISNAVTQSLYTASNVTMISLTFDALNLVILRLETTTDVRQMVHLKIYAISGTLQNKLLFLPPSVFLMFCMFLCQFIKCYFHGARKEKHPGKPFTRIILK